MKKQKDAIVVIDPISSARRYGMEIRRKGYYAVAVITRDKFPDYLHKFYGVDAFDEIIYVSDFSDATEKLNDIHIRAIIPGSDSALKVSDKLADYFSVVGNPVATYLSRVSKIDIKRRLFLKGVKTTPSLQVSLDDITVGAMIGIPFPVIVKPSLGTGSKNVKICNSKSEVYTAVATIEVGHENSSIEERVALVEKYIEGQEYFVATANFGKGKPKKILCFAQYEKIKVEGSPSVYKNIRSIPLENRMANSAFSYVKKINRAIEADVGINDVELKINSSGVYLIEQNGRLPGANVPALIELCTGFNVYDLNIDIFLGANAFMFSPPTYKKHFCICCLIADRGGALEKIEGVSDIEDLPSFHSINLLVAEGDNVEPTRDFLSTWGLVYLIHEDSEVLRVDSANVHEWMKLVYR